jgi:hypothetical protein
MDGTLKAGVGALRFGAEARLSHRCSQMIDSAVFMLRAWFRLVFGISIIVQANGGVGQVEDVRGECVVGPQLVVHV